MQRAIRANIDFSQGHVWTPTVVLPPDGRTVLINNLPSVVVGDEYNAGIHIHPVFGPSHVPIAAAGSPTVFIQGLPVHRDGDAITCGDIADNGSVNVLVGDGGGALGSPGGGPVGGTGGTAGTGGGAGGTASNGSTNTVGYTNGLPIASYAPLEAPRVNDIIGRFVEGCNITPVGPTELYTPQKEEGTGAIYRNSPETGSNLPANAAPSARRPIAINNFRFEGDNYGFSIDPDTGVISGKLNRFSLSNSRLTVKFNNFVGEGRFILTLRTIVVNNCS